MRADTADPLTVRKRSVIPIAEAAEILHMHPTTARRLAAEGRFPGALPKIGQAWVVSLEGLDAYLASYQRVEVGAL